MNVAETPHNTGFSSHGPQIESTDPAALPDDTQAVQLRLLDPANYRRTDRSPYTPNVLKGAVDHFMRYVELDEGDPGYVVTAEGTVENHYVRTYDPETWGAAADVFELRFIERRLADLNAMTTYQGAVLLFGADAVREATDGY